METRSQNPKANGMSTLSEQQLEARVLELRKSPMRKDLQKNRRLQIIYVLKARDGMKRAMKSPGKEKLLESKESKLCMQAFDARLDKVGGGVNRGADVPECVRMYVKG